MFGARELGLWGLKGCHQICLGRCSPIARTTHPGGQVMADYLWSQLTPWIKDDIKNVTCADAVAAVNNVPFVGIHVRRGDKVKRHEAEYYEAEVSDILIYGPCESCPEH